MKQILSLDYCTNEISLEEAVERVRSELALKLAEQ